MSDRHEQDSNVATLRLPSIRSMPPVNAAASIGKVSDAPPIKSFDHLYYLGMKSIASWAIVTSAGIIQNDSLDNPEEAQRLSLAATESWLSIRRR